MSYALLVNSIRPLGGALAADGTADMHVKDGAAVMVYNEVAEEFSNAYQKGRGRAVYGAVSVSNASNTLTCSFFRVRLVIHCFCSL